VKAKRSSVGNLSDRVLAVYEAYATRPYGFSPLLDQMPPSRERVLWFGGGGDDIEGAAWKPYGSRTLKQLTESQIESGKVVDGDVAVISNRGIRERLDTSVEAFLERFRADILRREDLALRASTGPETWYLVLLHPRPD